MLQKCEIELFLKLLSGNSINNHLQLIKIDKKVI